MSENSAMTQSYMDIYDNYIIFIVKRLHFTMTDSREQSSFNPNFRGV